MQQHIALRGHRNDVPTDHALLRNKIRRGNNILLNYFNYAKRNAIYVSKEIQNEFIIIALDLVKESIIKDIKVTKFWTTMANKTQEKAKQEQQAIVARYVICTDSRSRSSRRSLFIN